MAMPRPRWPHLQLHIFQNGRKQWFVRFRHERRIWLQAPYGSPEFEAEYREALWGKKSPKLPRPRTEDGSLAWLIARYQGSSAWSGLSLATQRQRTNFFKHTVMQAGDIPFRSVTTKHIRDGRERRASTPSQANNWLDAMRVLFRWAVEHEFLEVNPVEGVKNVKRPSASGGFLAWGDADIEAFERRWPIGSRERLAFAILLFTGLRRGDAARLGRQHVKAGVFYLRAEKTGFQLTIPILPELQRIIDATPTKMTRLGEDDAVVFPEGWASNLTFIATESGAPMTKESFGNWFREACREAGIRGKSAHGLRKAAATRLANAGVSEAELDAIMGWTPGSGMSRIYTRGRDTERLARQAVKKLEQSK